MQLIFVRHTRVGVAPGTCYGWSDVPVASTFEEEASRVADLLERKAPFDAVFTSPLTRCTLLAERCGFAHARRAERLKEMHMGQWEMLRYDDIDDPHLQTWYADYLHERTTGGESFQDLRQRVGSFLDSLRTLPYRRVLIFTHAGVIVSAGLYAGLFDEAEAFDHQPDHGTLVQIEIEG